MKNMTDERLDQLLGEYFASEPSCVLTYRGEPAAKAAPLLFPYRRVLATAASLVLVTLLSLTLYFSVGNNITDMIVSSPSEQDAAPSESGRGEGTRSDPSDASDETVSESTHSVTPPAADSTVLPSEVIGTGPSAGVTPTEKRSSGRTPSGASPTTPQATQSADGAVSPQPTEKTPEPPISTEAPAPVSPTQRPTIPRDPPWNPEPEEPTGSGDAPGEPVVYPTQPEPKNYCYAYIWYDNCAYYCSIEDANGNILGDPDPYSAQHSAEIVYTYSNGYALLRWSPNEHGIRPSGGYHHYKFINEYGNTVFEDYVYVQGVQ